MTSSHLCSRSGADLKSVIKIAMMFVALCSAMTIAGCGFDVDVTLVSQQSWKVGDVTVTEQIDCWAGFPDHRYKRSYTVRANGDTIEIGQYEDESSRGVSEAPEFSDGRLIVMSGSHVFVWSPDEAVTMFNLFTVDGWVEYSRSMRINGCYDYNATDVQLSGKQWDIRYDRVGNHQELPNELHCRSKDGGKLFQLVLKSPPEE